MSLFPKKKRSIPLKGQRSLSHTHTHTLCHNLLTFVLFQTCMTLFSVEHKRRYVLVLLFFGQQNSLVADFYRNFDLNDNLNMQEM